MATRTFEVVLTAKTWRMYLAYFLLWPIARFLRYPGSTFTKLAGVRVEMK